MLSFVVTKVTSDFVSRIWFYLFACLGLLSFLWALKIQGAALLRAYWYKKTLKNMGVFLCSLLRARGRVLVSKLFIPRLSLLVMA